jgi:hypothetical protein
MLRSPFRRFVLVLAMVCFSATPALAQEDDTTRARAEFQHGVEFFQQSDFQRALDAFQEAYRLAPHASVRLNIANCYVELRRPVEALFHFEHFLSEADHPPAAQRREVEATIRQLRSQIGTITFQVTPDGASITIDGSDTRRAPVVEPVRVPAGRHTVDIRLDGYRTETQTVEVTGGGDARVAIRLSRAEPVATTTTATTTTTTTATATTPAETATTTTPTETDATTTPTETTTTSTATASVSTEDEHHDDGGGLRITWPTILAAGVTGAAVITAIITGALSLSANSAFNADVADSNNPLLSDADRMAAYNDGLRDASNARTFAAVTDVMIVVSVLGAAATTTLFILDQTNAPQSGETVAVVPVITPWGGALTAAGRF